MVEVVVVALAYVIGMTPSAVVMGRLRGTDPLVEGSGNPGATNVVRTMGVRAGVVVALVDIAKGVAPTALGYLVGGRGLAAACWAAAVAGHIVPAFGWRRGGKGVATACGGALVLYPVVWIVLLVVFALVTMVTRTASIASLTISVGLVIGVALSGRAGWETVVTAAISFVVIVRHHRNIRRLFHGDTGPSDTPVPPPNTQREAT